MLVKFRRGLVATTALALLASAGAAFAAPPASSGPASPAKTIHLKPHALDAYVGNYRLAPGFILKIFRRGDQLYAQATRQGAAPIYPSAKDQFLYKIVNAQISFERNADGKVEGLVLHQHGDHPAPRVTSVAGAAPAQALPSATAWIAEAAVGAKTLPIAVQRKGFVLRGVLDLPAGKGPFGVVDIIPGSGSVDINGNAGPLQFGMYKQLAAALVKAGWAVARVAKRGMPPSTGDGNDIVFSDQVADNLAIVEALSKNPHVNPDSIVVAGHSIGGLIAPKLATETKLAGLILLEAPGEKMANIIVYQTLRLRRQAGASATKLAALEAHITKLNSLVAKAPPGQTVSYGAESSIFARIFAHSPEMVQLFKSWYAQNPLATVRKVHVPVLVVQGGQDTQTPPGNGKRLVKALPHGKLLYLPQMDHDLTLEQEGIGKDAKLAPKLTAGIVDWLNSLKPL